MAVTDQTTAPEFDPVTEIDIELAEYESTEPLELSDAAIEMLRSEVNKKKERLKVEFDRDGLATITATEHVGIVSLPGELTIQIRPKSRGTNLMHLLRYTHGVESTTVEHETSIAAGRNFIEALAALFEAELQRVIRTGLHKSYRERQNAEKYLRGRLNIQRQLQRQGVAPTKFECTYDELTYDILPNQAILYATSILSRFVKQEYLERALTRHRRLLRQEVTLTPVRPAELERVELSRLNEHYTDLLRLTKLILESLYVRELVTGRHSSFALLIDMNRVFERTVERAFEEALRDADSWGLETQYSTRNLVTGGKFRVSIRPDILLKNADGTPVLVADAKWKIGRPSTADFYQMTAYQLAHDVPGTLVYPAQHGSLETRYSVLDQYPLQLVELPIPTMDESFADFTNRLKRKLRDQIRELVSGTEHTRPES